MTQTVAPAEEIPAESLSLAAPGPSGTARKHPARPVPRRSLPGTAVAEAGIVRSRRRLKADRRAALLRAAAELFAARGFRAVRLEDLGAAVGISGPAVYRHFPNKEGVLVELLVGISERLLAGGLEAHAEELDAEAELRALIGFHVDFALRDRELIRIQDRDFSALPEPAKHRVRTLQRRYVELWVDAQRRYDPAVDAATARLQAHAAFGLINSTPYSTAGEIDASHSREILAAMATAALCPKVRAEG